ncbi:MAG TPA: serine hydrolase [Candidatus Dormibacteraeota bacterium]|jgi:CubicO group peptidase (beta-lactamase class C family)|nr:serine hydrolase [Candidatus Dormibacteraeota bacterium]
MKQNLKLLVIALAFFAFPALAQEHPTQRLDGSKISTAEIDSTITRLMRATEVTGAGIAIFNEGKVAYAKGYGLRDKEKNLPFTPDTVLTAASLTKSAFACMVMQLVQEKLLDLDKPVYLYLPKPLPEYSNYNDLATDPRYKKITARMILSHTTGFPNWRWFQDDKKLSINFEPGSRYAYSGEGIVLLQLIVETITGKSVQELMQERIFTPLGMTRSSMISDEKFEPDVANRYDEYGRPLGREQRTKANAAGSLQTTLNDYAKLLTAILQNKVLNKETRDLMLSPQIQIFSRTQFPTFSTETTEANKSIHLSYGLGWGLYSTPYGKAFFKEGHDEGWRNYAVSFENGIGILILTNSSNGEGIFKELLETLLKNTFTPIEWEGYTPYNQLPPRPPLKEHKLVSVPPELLEKYAGRYGDPPNLILTVRREGDHLSIQENDEPKQELFPESQHRFFSKSSDDVFSFQLDSTGRVASMTLHAPGRDILIKRLN